MISMCFSFIFYFSLNKQARRELSRLFGCICPKIYAPVVCDHGKTYPNQCVADCRNARNCVPTGGV